MEEVIVINYTGRTGGGPIDAFEMAKAMIKNGKNVAAVISDECSNLNEWRKLPLIELIAIPTYSNVRTLLVNTLKFYLSGDKRIRELKNKYKIEYIYCPMVSLWTRMINRKIGRTIKICVVNHDPIPHSGEKTVYLANLFGMQKLYREADTIVVHSRRFVEYVKERYRKETDVLYIPLGRQKYIKEFERRTISGLYDAQKTNFLFFGRIEAYKGIEVLLNAYEIMRKRCSDVSLTVVGAGDCSRYSLQMERLHVHVVNRWVGDEEIGDYFRGENLVLVLPYLDATQSGVVLVALEYGIPAICSDVGGLTEQVDDGETGVLVPAGDSEKLSEVMMRIAKEREYRESLTRGIPKMLKRLEWTELACTLDSFMRRKSF